MQFDNFFIDYKYKAQNNFRAHHMVKTTTL